MHDFLVYTRTERLLDGIIHVLGVSGALIAMAWMLPRLGPHTWLPGLIYAAGLIGMLTASAVYNLWPVSRTKAMLRRIDHAMIFVMIAGSYTPFALCALPPSLGVPLLSAVWAIAGAGAALRVIADNRYKLAFVGLYLAQGWMVLAVVRTIAAGVNPRVLALLVAGGLVYSIGAILQTREHWRYHNVIWHALVLLAACLHLAAIAGVLRV